MGYFKDEGLDVEISDFATSGAAMTLLLSKGNLDVGAGNLTSGLFNAILNGENFKLVADKGHVEKGKEYMQLVVRKDHLDSKRYKTIKDLKEFKIGITAIDGVSQQIVIDMFLKSVGLNDSSIEYIKMSYAEMNIALKTKNIDAAIQIEPFLTKALQKGYISIVSSTADIHPNQQSAALFYSPKFMKRKKDAVKFMKAYLRGVRAYNQAISGSNPEIVTELKKIFKIEDSEWIEMRPVGLHDDGHLNTKDLLSDLAWYKEKGFLPRVPLESEVIDSYFFTEANKTLSK